MRENPWHIRLPNTEHFQWFKNLVDLHELTTEWVKNVQTHRPSYGLTRGLSKEVSENLWMLDSLCKKDLVDFLDDTQPEDLLRRLENAVWTVQSWTLSSLYSRASATDVSSLDSVLEQISWKLGKTCAEIRWPELIKEGQQELRDILLALNDSPFCGYPQGSGFLVKRAVRTEVQIELRNCPHQMQYPETRLVADRLCRFHGHWIRGFVSRLNHQVMMEHRVQTPRCIQRWLVT